jgi:hypothetical protein
MIFRLFELFQQGRELRRDPVGFGSGLGRDMVAPMFIIPVLLLACGSLGMLALWWWVGWGVFLFASIVLVIGVLIVHALYVLVSRMFNRAESVAQDGFVSAQEHIVGRNRGAIIDTTSHE